MASLLCNACSKLLKDVHNSYYHLDPRLFTVFNLLVIFSFIECVRRIARELDPSPKQRDLTGYWGGLRLSSHFHLHALKNREVANSLPWFSLSHHFFTYLELATNNNSKCMIYNIFNSSVPSLVFLSAVQNEHEYVKTNKYLWLIY